VTEDGRVIVGGRVLAAGELISIDGGTGEVFAGAAAVSQTGAPPELEVLLDWADRLRAGRFAVRGNADDGPAAAHARALGAEGIGLCRTEHMFLSDDRLPLVRRLILSDDPRVDIEALAALEEAQQEDFMDLMRAMDGLPVTVRLLDPPLHEFLPDLEPLIVREALGQLDDAGAQELAAIRRLRECNPMIGTRGVRLGLVKPGLYPMQVRAVGRAVACLREEGLDPHVEIMIPLVVDAAELAMARRWVAQAEAELNELGLGSPSMKVGTMIETPRAALVAGELAAVADFFSYGTNDLTQLTFAFSRDDVESELLPLYLSEGLLPHDPFEVLDQVGVGFLIRQSIEAAHAIDPGLPIGACGEQAGDPDSAAFLVACGIDYVSCSPYRLPVVRLAVAQALLNLGRAGPLEETPDEEAAPTPDREDIDLPPDAEFLLRHALVVRTFATVDGMAGSTGLPMPWIEARLTQGKEEGWVRLHPARGLWQLMPAERTAHLTSLPDVGPEALDQLRSTYTEFLDLNGQFKLLCSAWQLRDGVPNDHTDAAYDQARIAELARMDQSAAMVIADLADAAPRLGRYLRRLRSAFQRVSDGERDAFTGVMRESYHDVWMELHEDLLRTLAIDRAAEGST
jgi:hypothetical protein